MKTITIHNRYTGEAIYSHTCKGNTIRKTVEKAVSEGVSLADAYLYKADLYNAYLYNANLENAYLRNANLKDAYLYNADLQGIKTNHTIPTIENIHQAVFAACQIEGSFDMNNWHSQCGTTHCVAGHVEILADAKELADKTSTLFAATMIYQKSSDIQPPKGLFFMDNEEALRELERLAEIEKNGK